MAQPNSCDVGLAGLAVMGQNLVLNMADHGFRVAVFNRTASVTDAFVARHGDDPFPRGGGIVGCASPRELVAAIRPPRVVVILVKAGPAVDAVCDELLAAGLRGEDVVVDGGNSHFSDTVRRGTTHRGRLHYVGSGISGGELGARFGPSLMPGGDAEAWPALRPVWEAIAARVEPATGRPLEGSAPGRPVTGGEPCAAWIGPDGSGHYVKMVHNGIEYADMQLIAEAYHLLRSETGREPASLGEVFSEWNRGELDSFLIEITAEILRQEDPETGRPMVDVIVDSVGMKGTGTWTAASALELGVPAASIAEAVFARAMSVRREERLEASRRLKGPRRARRPGGDELVGAVRDALYCSKICAYAQGFQLMRDAAAVYGWPLRFGQIARIWRGGCIIRAAFLQRITDAFERRPDLANLLLDDYFAGQIAARQESWREIVARAAHRGIPTPAFFSSLAYYDACRTETLPANLLAAQRDFFGAHGFARVDRPADRTFHMRWSGAERQQVGT
jgi:6-phosphogluconate dehydrogenase